MATVNPLLNTAKVEDDERSKRETHKEIVPRLRRPRCRYRIAMVCDFFYPRLGGVENHIWSLSQHLLRLGHKVIVITHAYASHNRKGVRYLGGEGISGGGGGDVHPLKVYYCPILPMTDQVALPTFTATLPLLRWIFLRERIQIVHAHQATSTMANESIVYASMLGLASVYTDHSLFGLNDVASVILNRVLQTTLSTVNAAICVSNACRDNLILRTHLDPATFRVIPNAVDPFKFTPATTVTNSGDNSSSNEDPHQPSNEGRIRVIVISRLVYRKGVDLLVAIIPHLCRQMDHVDFVIGGDGAKLLNVQEMVERERLQERVQLIGAVPHAHVRNVLITGQVFLNCSLTESFCIAVLEAACCGLRVVSTNVGGLPEVLPHDIMLLAKPNVPDMLETLKHAIQLQSDPTTALDPLQTHERVKHMYSWSRVAQETAQVYDGIVQSHDEESGALRQQHSLRHRLACYRRLGTITGMVVCFLAVTVELWLCLVSWWQPSDHIDTVPDLTTEAECEGEYNNQFCNESNDKK